MKYIWAVLVFVLFHEASAVCTSPSGVAGQMQWITADSKVKYCDGTNWKDTTQSVSTSCSGLTAGTINYSAGDLRYCDGTNWNTMSSSTSLGACVGTTAGTTTWDSGLVAMKVCDGAIWKSLELIEVDSCQGSPTPGDVCLGGPIYLGSLSPGATSGTGTDKYMTTAGGCSDIPAGSVSGGTGASSYASADFTPATCSGTDALTKYWNDGTSNWYDIPGLTNFTSTGGTGSGAINTDQYYGSQNTTNIVAETAPGNGGYHAAARYCDKLSWGGYTDWHLPNRAELNLMYTNVVSIPGLDTSGNYYWASTEYSSNPAWIQRFSDGYQNAVNKTNTYRVRCVRRF